MINPVKQKTLLLSHFNYSKDGPIHGPVHTIISYLARRKTPYIYIGYPLYPGEKSLLTKFDSKKEVTKKFGSTFKANILLKSLYEILTTLSYVYQFKPSLIVAIDPLNALAAILAKKVGIVNKVIFYTVDYTPSRFPNRIVNRLYHLIDEYCVKNSDFVWSVSNKIVEKRKEQGLPDIKNRYVPNAPSCKAGKPLPANRVNRFNIMMVSGITHAPSFTIVIDAMSSLVNKYPKLKLSIIGGGSAEEEFKTKIEKSKLKGHVEFLGQLDHKTLLKTLPKGGLGLAIYTSDYDWVNYGDSMKAREYLLSGLPTIITNVVSTGEDIRKFNAGFVVNPLRLDIQRAVEKILNDSSLWKKQRENAIKLSKEFDIDKILDISFRAI